MSFVAKNQRKSTFQFYFQYVIFFFIVYLGWHQLKTNEDFLKIKCLGWKFCFEKGGICITWKFG